jgi:hypothetical protein
LILDGDNEMPDSHANYLSDMGRHVAEMAIEAKGKLDESSDLFSCGKLMAYYEVVSLMKQQADAFQLPIEDVGLAGIDPERDLLQPPNSQDG